MALNLLSKSHTLLSTAHQLLNFVQVFLLTAVLCIFCDLDVGPTVSDSDVLDEIRAVSDWLTLKGVDEGAVTLIETIRAADLHSKRSII